VIGSGQFQNKQPREPKSEPTTKNLLLKNSNIAQVSVFEGVKLNLFGEVLIQVVNF
jgi:hypothetical protein